MDPITLSTVTAALTVLGAEVARSTASEAGRAAWSSVVKLFGWKQPPAEPELAAAVARRLQAEPELLTRAAELVGQAGVGSAGTLVGKR